MLNNISYNPKKSIQAQFLENLALNIDNLIWIASSITIVGDHNINYLNNNEKQNIFTVTVPYGLSIASPEEKTRVCKSTSNKLGYVFG